MKALRVKSVPRGAKAKTSTERVVAVDRESEALRLRKMGYTYPQIAAELNIALGTAFNAVKRGLEKLNATVKETAEEVRTLEVDRLDMCVLAAAARVEEGDLEAIGPLLRVMERRAKLLGLDAPPPVAAEGADLLEQLAAQLRARNAPPAAEAPQEPDLEGAGQSAPMESEP